MPSVEYDAFQPALFSFRWAHDTSQLRRDGLKPLLIVRIPINCPLQAFFEGDGGLEAKFSGFLAIE